uniref:Uncharacterized protein n=1 Tax=Arundo donax TaxID=35708 RepID=A0A0A9BZ85_ARUDO
MPGIRIPRWQLGSGVGGRGVTSIGGGEGLHRWRERAIRSSLLPNVARAAGRKGGSDQQVTRRRRDG